MRSCRTARGIAAALLLGLAAGSARAGDMAGMGWLDDIDAEHGQLLIGKQTYRVTRETRLEGVAGEPVNYSELEELNHPWVAYAARSGAPLPVLERLRVIDLDADE
jgi:hypothetical protein